MIETLTLTPHAPREIDFARRHCVRDLYITQSALQGISDLAADAFNDDLDPTREFTGIERNALLCAVQALSRHLAVDIETLDNALGNALDREVTS